MNCNETDIRKQICDIGKRIYDRKMVAANDGNISVKLSDNEFLCTPTGISKGFMTPECICRVDRNGNLLEACEDFRPSSEMKMHMHVYKMRPDVGAVVHAHPVFATTFAVCHIPLSDPITAEAVMFLGSVPVADYGTPSTSEIPDAIEPLLKDNDQLLLANHGALTYGPDLLSAYYKMESVEFYAELLYRTRQMGGGVMLDEASLQKIKDLG